MKSSEKLFMAQGEESEGGHGQADRSPAQQNRLSYGQALVHIQKLLVFLFEARGIELNDPGRDHTVPL